MKKRIKVTIGIPAYNEGLNILSLLSDLLVQKSNDWVIERIIIFSDGSTDDTNEKVYLIQNSKIDLIVSKKRLGVSLAQNKIMQRAKGDILIMLNADIRIPDRRFINTIVQSFKKNENIGLVSVKTIPLEGRTYFERIINFSHLEKTKLYRAMSRDNIFLNHGRARAFSKAFYTALKYPNVIADDAYSYLKCKTLGLNFVYADNSYILFRSPNTMTDHLKQSERFKIGKKQLYTYFSKSTVDTMYLIPLSTSIRIGLHSLINNPYFSVGYVYILVYSYIISFLGVIQIQSAWEQSKTSKSL